MSTKAFFWKIFTLALIVLIIIIGFVFSNYLIARYTVFKLDDKINKIVLGSSTTECAINDVLIPNSINLSSSADSYMYSYLKIKYLLEINPYIDTVFLDFCPGSFSKKIEKRWTLDFSHFKSRIGNYWYLIDEKVNAFYYQKFGQNYITTLIKLVPVTSIQNIKYVIKDGNLKSRYGGFNIPANNKLEESIRMSMELNPFDSIYNSSNIEIYFLDEILNICAEHNVRIILISTPWRIEYYNHMKSSYTSFISYYRNNLSEISWCNFYKMNLSKDCFSDVGHLNQKGSTTFTNQLLVTLKTDSLLSFNNQDTINNKNVK